MGVVRLSFLSLLLPKSTVWVKKSPPLPPCDLRFSDIFSQTVENFKSVLHTYVPICARLQIFIQLSQILTKLCHITRDYLVEIICRKCPQSAETHAFRRLRKSLIALLIVDCGKSSQICCIYTVISTLDYKFLFKYLQLWQSYAILSATT